MLTAKVLWHELYIIIVTEINIIHGVASSLPTPAFTTSLLTSTFPLLLFLCILVFFIVRRIIHLLLSIILSLKLSGHLFRLVYASGTTTTNWWQFNLLIWRLFNFFNHVHGSSRWRFDVINRLFFCCNLLPDKLCHFNFRCGGFLFRYFANFFILRLKWWCSNFTLRCWIQLSFLLHRCLIFLYHRLLNFIDWHFYLDVLCYALNFSLFIPLPFCLLS